MYIVPQVVALPAVGIMQKGGLPFYKKFRKLSQRSTISS